MIAQASCSNERRSMGLSLGFAPITTQFVGHLCRIAANSLRSVTSGMHHRAHGRHSVLTQQLRLTLSRRCNAARSWPLRGVLAAAEPVTAPRTPMDHSVPAGKM
jgi:hypothetical protein